MRSFTANIKQLFNFVNNEQGKGVLIDNGVSQYVIPLYQREFKWELDKVDVLINDVISRDKFLGIVIFDKNADSYEIVDGQQRITTLVLALVALFNLYEGSPKEQASIIKILKNNDNEWILRNDSVGEYLKEDGNRIILNIDEDKDVYFQKEIFKEAYKVIERILSAYEVKQLKDIKNKILDSEMGVFVNEYNTNAHPIEQTFLDINEKSQILDRENIFKGHCFKNYDNDKIYELRDDWVELKKYGAQFKKMSVDDLGQFIYLFLLITESNAIKENLYEKGKHLLEGKTMDETAEILDNMITFAKSNSLLFDQLKNEDYYFEDCCPNYRRFKNTGQHHSLKRVTYEILSDTRALYQKLPLLFFVYYLNTYPEMASNMKYDHFKKIINDLFISGMIFSYSSGRKSKANIDYTIRDALKNTMSIDKAAKASKELRKSKVNEFEIAIKNHSPDYLKFVFGVIDNYNSQKSYLDAKYYKSNITLEHFIMPNNRKSKIMYKTREEVIDITVDKGLGKEYKKFLGNYLLLEKELNEDLKSYDVVTKIDMINKFYQSKTMPNHVRTYISLIEQMSEYKELLECNRKDKFDEIDSKYLAFLKAYFEEEFQVKIIKELKKEFEIVFQN